VNCEPQLQPDGKTIHVIFRNETNELEFGKMSLDLLEHLKSSLKNNDLEFTTEVSIEKAKKVLYTNRDKFDHYAEKQPKLLDWATRLGLELK
jgi:DNA polymerase-3 subunit gamma/tau